MHPSTLQGSGFAHELHPQKYEAGMRRRSMALGHTLTVLAVFAPPLVICLTLGFDQDVVFFTGRLGLLPLLMTLLLPVLPMVHLFVGPTSGHFFVASLVVPAFVFWAVGGILGSTTDIAQTAMLNRDCHSYKPKQELHRSYDLAMNFKNTICAGEETIQTCNGYNEIAQSNLGNFRYLAALETRFQCGGVCSSGPPLWARKPADRSGTPPASLVPICDLFVAQWLQGASTQASIVKWYGLIVGMLSVPLGFFLFEPLAKP